MSEFAEGEWFGRFLTLRDADGRLHGVAASAIIAVSPDDDGGALLLLPAGRLLRVSQPAETIMQWLSASRHAHA